jgi:hypothetical protein
MKMDRFSQKYRSFYLLQFSFYRELLKFMKAGRGALKISFTKEIKQFERFDWKNPKIYFQIGFLFLFLAGILMLIENSEEVEEKTAALKNLGWIQREMAPCQLKQEGFYLAEGNTHSVEFFFSSNGEIFSRGEQPWPEAPIDCIALKQPLKIEEI